MPLKLTIAGKEDISGTKTTINLELPKLYNTPTNLPINIIRGKKDGPVVEKKRPPVEKATHTIVKAVSPLDKAAFFFFDAFGSPAINEISAKNAYIRLEPGCKFEYWISRLLYEFELNHSNHLELQLVGETDAKYNGNYYISDIVFRRKDSNGKVMQCA